MSKQIIDYGFGIIETKETGYRCTRCFNKDGANIAIKIN